MLSSAPVLLGFSTFLTVVQVSGCTVRVNVLPSLWTKNLTNYQVPKTANQNAKRLLLNLESGDFLNKNVNSFAVLA
jgi:hypothetical protein